MVCNGLPKQFYLSIYQRADEADGALLELTDAVEACDLVVDLAPVVEGARLDVLARPLLEQVEAVQQLEG